MRAITVYQPELGPLAVVIDAFFEQAFTAVDGSLFTPGVPVWTINNLTELKERFIDRPDVSEANFEEKLTQQLAGASDQAIQLMAEVLYVYYMVSDDIKPTTKIGNVEAILGWMKRPSSVPESLKAAASLGLTGTGVYYLTNKPFQLAFIILTVLTWKKLSDSDRSELLKDAWEFKKFIMKVPENSANPMRMVLLHMMFPDTFEIILSAAHKKRICRAFPAIAPDELDEDRKLAAIKATLSGTGEKNIWTFYRPDVRVLWDKTKAADEVSPVSVSKRKTNQIQSIVDVAEDLHLAEEWLSEIRDLLLDRRQLIFHGPPGTGKTLIARALASTIASEGASHFVQFHPAYSYEDFIEGLRPKVGSASGSFEVRPGPLRRVAKQAASDPNKLYVLVIDEINRGNLARVMGELVFLLEYRDTPVTLPYSGDAFSLPKNLLIIGTMNTTDRSIALIDAAIRRRFAFVRLAADCQPINEVLSSWLETNAKSLGWVDALVTRANEILHSPDHAIGPAFFMQKGLNEAKVERIWKWQVLPYLDEFLHDAPELKARLEYASLRKDVEAELADTP